MKECACLLPGIFAPGLRIFSGAEVSNVEHDAIHGPAKQDFIFLSKHEISHPQQASQCKRGEILALYIVTTINNSVRLPVSFCLRKKPFCSNSSGSHVTAV
jgi:hypothetical protein